MAESFPPFLIFFGFLWLFIFAPANLSCAFFFGRCFFVFLEEKQSKFKPLVKEHNGSLIKEMGDGTLSQYPSAIDASKCSVELQKLIKDNDKLNVRVGIHLGDTLFKDGDVFGDGVNIAARLESMSPAGGILVSKNVYDELLSRQGFEGVSLGMQSLKGVGLCQPSLGLL